MRILSWNVCGDLGTAPRTAEKVDELRAILNYWEEGEEGEERQEETESDPVEIVCLQETAGRNGQLNQYLNDVGYTTYLEPEGDTGNGRTYVIGVREDLGIEPVETYDFHQSFKFEEIATSPTRVPYGIKLRKDGIEFYVYTLHATLGGRRIEALELFSDSLNNSEDNIVIAGDLNCEAEELEEDGISDCIELFPDFDGCRNHLDYIFVRGNLGCVNGMNSDFSNSDHHPISAQIVFK